MGLWPVREDLPTEEGLRSLRSECCLVAMRLLGPPMRGWEEKAPVVNFELGLPPIVEPGTWAEKARLRLLGGSCLWGWEASEF